MDLWATSFLVVNFGNKFPLVAAFEKPQPDLRHVLNRACNDGVLGFLVRTNNVASKYYLHELLSLCFDVREIVHDETSKAQPHCDELGVVFQEKSSVAIVRRYCAAQRDAAIHRHMSKHEVQHFSSNVVEIYVDRTVFCGARQVRPERRTLVVETYTTSIMIFRARHKGQDVTYTNLHRDFLPTDTSRPSLRSL